jgi:hypothetical protein
MPDAGTPDAAPPVGIDAGSPADPDAGTTSPDPDGGGETGGCAAGGSSAGAGAIAVIGALAVSRKD